MAKPNISLGHGRAEQHCTLVQLVLQITLSTLCLLYILYSTDTSQLAKLGI
jgi:hypothetical protein